MQCAVSNQIKFTIKHFYDPTFYCYLKKKHPSEPFPFGAYSFMWDIISSSLTSSGLWNEWKFNDTPHIISCNRSIFLLFNMMALQSVDCIVFGHDISRVIIIITLVIGGIVKVEWYFSDSNFWSIVEWGWDSLLLVEFPNRVSSRYIGSLSRFLLVDLLACNL